MLNNSLRTTATSCFDRSASRLAQAGVPFVLGRQTPPQHDERAGRHQSCQSYHRAATDVVGGIVDISPSDIVKRRIATWPGMAAEIVQATRRGRIETRLCAPVHLLAVFERGVRHEGGT